MKQLQVKEMETLKGGSWECLGPGLTAMEIAGPTGLGALFAGIIVYSACSLMSK